MTTEKITHEYLDQHAHLRRVDPEKYLGLINRLIAQDPDDKSAYFTRHFFWLNRGEYELALADLDRRYAKKRLSKRDRFFKHFFRGDVFREMGRYRDAIAEFDKTEATSPRDWKEISGPWHRADCHARLGDLERALADCAALPDKHWRPSMGGLPGGDKAQVAAELRRRAKAANAEKRKKR